MPQQIKFPEDVDHYLATEIKHKAIWGPYDSPPIPLYVSPFLSKPKPNSDHRRMIIDLSWPKGHSVNSATCTNIHVKAACALCYPTIDRMVEAAVQANHSDTCFLFKVDLEWAFRNLHIDPNDYDSLGLYWNQAYFVDSGVPFGAKLVLIDAIRFIMGQYGYQIFNYSDDILGIHSNKKLSDDAYMFLLALLQDLGLPVSTKTLEAPCRELTCLGIELDMCHLQIRMPQPKLNEIIALCSKWSHRTQATKNQLQSLICKLVYISKCVRPVRLFITKCYSFYVRRLTQGTSLSLRSLQRTSTGSISLLCLLMA